MKKALLIVLLLCFSVSLGFAGRFGKEAKQQKFEETMKPLTEIDLSVLEEFALESKELKALEKQNQKYDKKLCSSVNIVTGSIFLTVGIWGLTISQPYGIVTGLVLTWNGIVRIIKAIRNKNIICPECDGNGEIKGYK